METRYEVAANIATTLGTEKWEGRLTARQQRDIFGGYYFGKRHLIVDPTGQGQVTAIKKVCFGTDWDEEYATFAQIAQM